ncbi:MAG: hypothetical protein M3Q99_16885 [Acidobacteriota bacterium]|nr:hypothetical protein [Acidobacteriota bacterium]
MNEPEFSLREQLDFLDSQVSLMEEVAKVFVDADLVTKADTQRDVDLMKSIRETIRFEHLIEQAANAENQALPEETIC